MAEDNRKAWRTSEAKAAFNAAWKLIESHDRSRDDEAAMLVDAFASRYLWETVGGDEQRFIADWQIAHVASLVGEASLALRFATTALARVEANGWTDCRLPSGSRLGVNQSPGRSLDTFPGCTRAADRRMRPNRRERVACALAGARLRWRLVHAGNSMPRNV